MFLSVQVRAVFILGFVVVMCFFDSETDVWGCERSLMKAVICKDAKLEVVEVLVSVFGKG